ncbi:asparagine synthetase B family protein [Sphingomonas koreensis]|nr:asparagine synthetase B family protein [Sphingomonas koreensis]
MAMRYLACLAPQGIVSGKSLRTLTGVATANPPLSLVLDTPTLAVIATGKLLAVGDRGIIVGDLFERGRSIGALSALTQRTIIDTGGASLIDDAWGNYVALLAPTDQQPALVLRAPFGTLPCYFVESGECVFVASDLALLRATGLVQPRVDGDELRRYLLSEDLVRPETCIQDLREIPGGWRATLTLPRVEIEPCWSPWPMMRPPRAISDATDAANRLRDAIGQVVSALITPTAKPLLRLSGGLDSSIMAAALVACDREVTALTFTAAHPASDERRFARLVAGHLSIPLIERALDSAEVDLEASDTLLPRPAQRAFEQASRALSSAAAAEIGADAVVDGGAGDQMFCSIASPRLAADCLVGGDASARFWPAVGDLATLSRSSVVKVAWQTWRSQRRSNAFRFPLDDRFLVGVEAADRVAASAHPWLDAPTDIPPGRAAHAALVVAAMALGEPRGADRPLAAVSPLLSQPVAECCLAIPSWMWIAGGRDRSIARAAFADRLPPTILTRRSKGSPDSFLVDLYDARRDQLRAMLLDGKLAAMELLDRAALASTLDDQRPVSGPAFYRILRLADAEAWARAVEA